MKKKELEILLQNIPSFNNPSPNLEQYLTSANIAADIIFTAHQLGNIENKTVVDLGCGTGIFSVGAFLTGAKKVIGIDIDKNIINIARDYVEKNNFKIIYKVQNVKDVDIKCDTVIMNPPFGAQKANQNADRKFIEKGFKLAPVLYSLHLSKTVPFIKKLVNSLKGDINYSKNYIFPIKWTFDFHKKRTSYFEVTLLRIETYS
jgi:putative methylase